MVLQEQEWQWDSASSRQNGWQRALDTTDYISGRYHGLNPYCNKIGGYGKFVMELSGLNSEVAPDTSA